TGSGGRHARRRRLPRWRDPRGYAAAVLVLLVAVGGLYLVTLDDDGGDRSGGPVDRAASGGTPGTGDAATSDPEATPDGWPTAGNTGWRHTGVTLTPYTGPVKITEPTVIDGKDITGCLVIQSS